MDPRFDAALAFTLPWEVGSDMVNGGYTNDPVDPGGETKWGISKRAHPQLDIKNLTLDEAKLIYFKEYWEPAGCPNFEFKLSIAAFDSAVNCGVACTQKWLRLYGASWEKLVLARMLHYFAIIKHNSSQMKFYKGWMNRLSSLTDKLMNP